MRPYEITAKTRHSDFHKLRSDTRVLILSADADLSYGWIEVEEILVNRGLRQFPEPPPRYRITFRPRSTYGNGGLGGYLRRFVRRREGQKPISNKVTSIQRTVQLGGIPLETKFLALVPNEQYKTYPDSEPEFKWEVCTALPVPNQAKYEKERLKAAYAQRRHLEKPTRFERVLDADEPQCVALAFPLDGVELEPLGDVGGS